MPVRDDPAGSAAPQRQPRAAGGLPATPARGICFASDYSASPGALVSEEVWYTAEQLLEAKTLLLRGSLPDLRMALLLLDNTAELLMHRALADFLMHNEHWEQMDRRAKEWMPTEEYTEWAARSKYVPLTRQDRKRLDRDFGAKADFLVVRGDLSDPIARFLKAMHLYRNEAYHRDRVREKTIGPVVKVLFRVVLDLLPQVGLPMMWSLGSTADIELNRKFGLGSYDRPEHRMKTLAASLSEGVEVQVPEIANQLANHLLARVEDVQSDLDFILNNATGPFGDRAGVLKRVQFWRAAEQAGRPPNEAEFEGFTPQITLADLERWSNDAEALRAQMEKLAVFLAFVEIEAQLEPVEEMVGEAAREVDRMIQHMIDVARGK